MSNILGAHHPLAQWLEPSAYIRVVVGSIPTGTTSFNIY